MNIGAFCFGVVIGWFVYFINRYRSGPIQLSDLTTIVTVLGSGFVAVSNKDPTIFPGYALGLVVGFFGYFVVLAALVAASQNFTTDWFLDGRCKAPQPPFYIPPGVGPTVHPMAVSALTPAVASEPPVMTPHGRSFRPAPSADRIAEVDPASPVRLTVVLKPRTPIDAAAYALGKGPTAEAYVARHATEAATLDAVATFARSHGLRVVSSDAATHTVELAGVQAQARAAFKPDDLAVYADAAGHRFVARSGHIWVPSNLADEVVAVMGFDQRPLARPHVRLKAADAEGLATAFKPREIAQKYQFPLAATGAGQAIALIELGGGYDAGQVARYFQNSQVARTGRLQATSVPGGANAPGQDDKSDGEVQLDIEVAGSIAPAADLRVWFAPNTGQGFYQAVQAAIADPQGPPAAVSISWGSSESRWAPQDMDAMDQLFQSAAARNITVCVASGDYGSSDDSPDGSDSVDFPASSPNVLGCGGASFAATGEVAWNNEQGASGGGFSVHFPRPSYQSGDQWRGVPDVCGDADPETGYKIEVNGAAKILGGTSAVAPLWSAFVALANEQLRKRVGFINPSLYSTPALLSDITVGNNGGYSAAVGWDPVTGLGSPRGDAIIEALRR